ncbi:MAG TPA: hypothetical protein VMH22_02780 [bacterium]|nr:hypothetical protein [bacterium]
MQLLWRRGATRAASFQQAKETGKGGPPAGYVHNLDAPGFRDVKKAVVAR